MKTLLLSLTLLYTVSVDAQNVNIPDANFKDYLVGNTLINTNSDAEIQVSEAVAFTGSILCVGQLISNLTGIEAFTAMKFLNCNDNQQTSLDLSNNTGLITLDCINNQLTSLDLSNITGLINLDCSDNQLTSLDVSNNTGLTLLDCYLNQISALDVSQNIALIDLKCNNNQLSSLDVSQNIALDILTCYTNQLTVLDVSQNTTLTRLRCFSNQLTSLDVTQCNLLTGLWCFQNQFTCLNVKNGNNSNFIAFYTYGNPNLTCIEVDDVAWSNLNWTVGTSIDATASFSTDCDNDCSASHLDIEELSINKELIRITDLMGRETEYKPNTPLLYIYSDGSVERVFKVEE